jgi:hypothetical protein
LPLFFSKFNTCHDAKKRSFSGSGDGRGGPRPIHPVPYRALKAWHTSPHVTGGDRALEIKQRSTERWEEEHRTACTGRGGGGSRLCPCNSPKRAEALITYFNSRSMLERGLGRLCVLHVSLISPGLAGREEQCLAANGTRQGIAHRGGQPQGLFAKEVRWEEY